MKPFPLNLIPHMDEILPVIQENIHANPSDFSLKLKPGSLPVPARDVAHLLDCYQRAAIKFPNLHTPGMLYTRKAIEQSTGEAVLQYKRLLFSGERAVDLTGGLGMDTDILASSCDEVVYVEREETLMQVARHNHGIIGYENITHVHADAETWLKLHEGEVFDLIYIDPSRRDEKGRHFLLKDCEPDVRLLYPLLDKMARKLIIKVSPMYDLTRLKRELPDIQDIYIISVSGEVKEILVVCIPGGIDEDKERLQIVVMLDRSGKMISEMGSGLYKGDNCEVASKPCLFLYEPDPAIIKAGQTKPLASLLGFYLLNHTTDYLTSDDDFPAFSGKKYAILDVLPYKPRQVSAYLAEKNITNVHIHKRDFPQSVEELYKRFSLRMGEDAHLFFTKDADGGLIMIVAEPVGQ